MQLVNIDTPQTVLSNDLISAIQSNDKSRALEILNDLEDTNIIFRSLYILSCRQKITESNPLSSAIVYTDAVTELVKRLFPDKPLTIIKGIVDYFCSLDYIDKDETFSKIDADKVSNPVLVSELEESILQGDFEKAILAAKNLLHVVDSKKYFNELLLGTAVKMFTPSGESIIVSNVLCKAIELFDWRVIDELIVYLLKYLTSSELKTAKQNIFPTEKEIKYAEYVLRAANYPNENGENLLFMAQARQIYRYASTKYKEIWGYLTTFIENKMSDSSLPEYEEISPVKGSIEDFEKSLNVGDPELTLALTNTLLQDEFSSKELFCSISLFMLENKLFNKSEHVIYLNVARRLATALGYPRNLHIYKPFLHYLFTIENKMN